METELDESELDNRLCVCGRLPDCKIPSSTCSSPMVKVYSRNPGEYGKDNTLICHVSGFHPPDISIQLLKNGVEIPDAKQTDLAFQQGWQFHLTKSVGFTPASGEEYTCRVRHLKNLNTYIWESDM
uniref:beta-2-microglobulin-like n=2 Tax=Oncorhynchus gorbuscha TaxID=8017 RepID=UPI001EAEA147|nr:beta-2-microglobulin-like [Oncorhynchus gorbuscha]